MHGEPQADPETVDTIVNVTNDAWRNLGTVVEKLMTDGTSDVYRRSLLHFDRLLVSQAMKISKGMQSHAAEILGLSRPTLRAKIRAMIAEGAQIDPAPSGS